jgi:hypothetical protein
MTLPTPKFQLSQTVYYADTGRERREYPCPDCLGARKWDCTSPAGGKFTVSCPRCAGGYSHSGADKLPSLGYLVYTPVVVPFLVQAIEVSTADWRGDHGPSVTYRDSVTGGSARSERDLYATKEEALAVAVAQCQTYNAKEATEPKALEKRYFSGLTFTDAAGKALRDGVFEAWTQYRQLRNAITDTVGEPDEFTRFNSQEELVEELWHNLDRVDKGRKTAPDIYGTNPIERLLDAAKATAGYEELDEAAIKELEAAVKELEATIKP